MLKDITLGQYVQKDSLIHNADPRSKILLSIIYVISIFLIKNIVFYIVPFIFVCLAIYASKLPISTVLKGLKPLKVLIIITFILNTFFGAGETIIFKLGFIQITKEGLVLASHFSLRLIFLILGTSILTLSTSPISIADGLELLLAPLKKLKFPVHELAMMMTIALRFIPTLMEETDKIMKAQMSRGADFETGNLFARAKAMVPLLVPLFISAFRRANELAMAMEARCYHGGEGRTRYRKLSFGINDFYCIVATIVYIVIIIILQALFL